MLERGGVLVMPRRKRRQAAQARHERIAGVANWTAFHCKLQPLCWVPWKQEGPRPWWHYRRLGR